LEIPGHGRGPLSRLGTIAPRLSDATVDSTKFFRRADARSVEYVKVCSLYGAGFYYMPGTDLCIKIGGWVRAEAAWGTNGNMTLYGTVRWWLLRHDFFGSAPYDADHRRQRTAWPCGHGGSRLGQLQPVLGFGFRHAYGLARGHAGASQPGLRHELAGLGRRLPHSMGRHQDVLPGRGSPVLEPAQRADRNGLRLASLPSPPAARLPTKPTRPTGWSAFALTANSCPNRLIEV
jgi:hypothetical protein